MTTLPRVLVTGATGKTGRATVLALTQQYSDIVQTRALVRTDDHRARELHDAGAEVVLGDMSDIRDLQRAMSGVQRAHLIVAVTNSSLDHALNFAVAAEAERLEHVVAIGQWLSSASHPSLMTRRTWLVDQVLRWIPEVDHTVINVGFFADNIMSVLGMAAQLGVLSNPAPYAGRTLRPTGPEVLPPEDIAAVFGEVLGRSLSSRVPPRRVRGRGNNQRRQGGDRETCRRPHDDRKALRLFGSAYAALSPESVPSAGADCQGHVDATSGSYALGARERPACCR